MIDAVDRSDLPTAIAAHRRLAPLVEAIMTRMPGAVSAKAALYLQGVLPHYAMRGPHVAAVAQQLRHGDRKSTRLNSSHVAISYAVFCLKKKTTTTPHN